MVKVAGDRRRFSPRQKPGGLGSMRTTDDRVEKDQRNLIEGRAVRAFSLKLGGLFSGDDFVMTGRRLAGVWSVSGWAGEGWMLRSIKCRIQG